MKDSERSVSTEQLKTYANTYPYPLAQIIQKYIKISYDNISEKHSVLCDAFEALVKLNAILAIKTLLANERQFAGVFPSGIDFLKHPSLGHWSSILRTVAKSSEEQPPFVEGIKQWYLSGKKDQRISDSYQALPEINYQKGTALVEGIINSLVTYRNKVWKGHGAFSVDKDNLQRRVDALETLVFTLFEAAAFYSEMDMVYIEEVKLPSPGIFEANAILLDGLGSQSRKYKSATPFAQGDIYLVIGADTDESQEIPLTPFVEWQKNPDGAYSFFYFNDAQRTKLEYLCYFDGTFYYHRELKAEFESILHVKLQEASENYEYIQFNFTQDERETKSREIFVQGQQLASDGKWEEALIFFENALEWYKDPQIMLARCRMLIKLDESPEYIETLLSDVEAIDPENKELAKVRNELKGSEDAQPDETKDSVDYSDYEEYKDHIYTMYDCVLPTKKGLRANYKLLLYILLFNAVLGFVMYLTSSELFLNFGVAAVLICIMEIMIIILVPRIKNYYASIYYQLYSQVSNMKKERYSKWYLQSLLRIFGHITADQNGRLKLNYKREKVFLIILTVFVVVWSFGQFYLYELPAGIAVPMILIGIPFWTVAAYAVRMLFMTTLFVNSFSKLSLNPAISESNNQGFTALLTGFFKTFGMFLLFDPFFQLYLALVYPSTPSGDWLSIGRTAIGFLAIVSIIIAWSIMVPVQIKKAAKRAQMNCLLRYQTHTIDSFNAFIKDPNDGRKSKLEWLLGAEKELRSMTSKIVKFRQTIYIILGNVFAIIISVAVALYDLGYLQQWFGHLFQ